MFDDTQDYGAPDAFSYHTASPYEQEEIAYTEPGSPEPPTVVPDVAPQELSEPLQPDIGHQTRFRLPFKNIVLISLALVLALSAAFGAFFYFSRPTPSRTLDAFCSGLIKSDYQGSYQQLSPNLQQIFTQKQFAAALASDKVIQCSYGQIDNAGKRAQTTLKLVHESMKSNQDSVVLVSEASDIWKIDMLHAPYDTTPPQEAHVHRLTVSSQQRLKDPAAIFAAHTRGGDTGVFIASGERVIIFLTARPGENSTCKAGAPADPERCPSLYYSLGLTDQAKEVGERVDFFASTSNTLFLGVNTPDQPTSIGDFQVTLVTLPKGTATGVWEGPDDKFITRSTHLTLSVHIFTHEASISQVEFLARREQANPTKLCQTNYSGQELVSCKWDFTISLSGSKVPIANGSITIGFSLLGGKAPIVNPDGERTGIARFIASLKSPVFAGYGAQDALNATTYQKVTMHWKVPMVTCPAQGNSNVSLFAGMSGVRDSSQFAQIGITSFCINGDLNYYGWYDMLPKPVKLLDYIVAPGDDITTSISYSNNQFELTLDDEQVGWHFSTKEPGIVKNTQSATCLISTFLDQDRQHSLRLSNFGTIDVSCDVDNQPIGQRDPQNLRIDMNGPEQKATVSDLDETGEHFTIQYLPS